VDLFKTIINPVVRFATSISCHINEEELRKVPKDGPLIVAANHISSLEVPIVVTRLDDRAMTGFAKAENWDHPFYRFIFEGWGAIPLRRGEADMTAMRAALATLKAGNILAIAPEGTRSGDGRLRRGLPGVVVLALKSGAPILPMVYYGGEQFKQNLRRFRRTPFNIVVGNAFHLNPGKEKTTHDVRQQMVDEIMYQLAAMLPPAYRGVYANLSLATERYLAFPPGSPSNLRSTPHPDLTAAG
jgi:1-acyl-sn-glycerol-3-phosphate acyltransferase